MLSPGEPDSEVEANIRTSETEQPGMGTAVGGAVGGALGVAGGLEVGMVAATALIPGVGPVFALGLLGAALLGLGGATVGAAAGTAVAAGAASAAGTLLFPFHALLHAERGPGIFA